MDKVKKFHFHFLFVSVAHLLALFMIVLATLAVITGIQQHKSLLNATPGFLATLLIFATDAGVATSIFSLEQSSLRGSWFGRRRWDIQYNNMVSLSRGSFLGVVPANVIVHRRGLEEVTFTLIYLNHNKLFVKSLIEKLRSVGRIVE